MPTTVSSKLGLYKVIWTNTIQSAINNGTARPLGQELPPQSHHSGTFATHQTRQGQSLDVSGLGKAELDRDQILGPTFPTSRGSSKTLTIR